MIRICFILAIFLFFECKPPCDCYTNKHLSTADNKILRPWKISEINTEQIFQILHEKKSDDIFGYHLVANKLGYRFVFLNKFGQLEVFDFQNLNNHWVIPFKNIVRPAEYYNSLFSNDTFHYVDLWGKKYFEYKVERDSSFSLIDSIDLSKIQGFEHYYISTNLGTQSLAYKYPYILVPYGHNTKKNFIDTWAYLKINLQTKKVAKVIRYPECYQCSNIYDQNSTTVFNADGSIICLFDQFDELHYLSTEEKRDTVFQLYHTCSFVAFDKSKEQNLAYIRKYLENGEKNIKVLNVNDIYHVVIKRNFKKELTDKSTYSIFVFDSQFKQVYSENIFHPVFTPTIFEYKKGFLIFNDSLNKAYYYDFEK